MTSLAQQIDALLANRGPNRATRRRMQKYLLTRKQKRESLARTNEQIGWMQPKKGK